MKYRIRTTFRFFFQFTVGITQDKQKGGRTVNYIWKKYFFQVARENI